MVSPKESLTPVPPHYHSFWNRFRNTFRKLATASWCGMTSPSGSVAPKLIWANLCKLLKSLATNSSVSWCATTNNLLRRVSHGLFFYQKLIFSKWSKSKMKGNSELNNWLKVCAINKTVILSSLVYQLSTTMKFRPKISKMHSNNSRKIIFPTWTIYLKRSKSIN